MAKMLSPYQYISISHIFPQGTLQESNDKIFYHKFIKSFVNPPWLKAAPSIFAFLYARKRSRMREGFEEYDFILSFLSVGSLRVVWFTEQIWFSHYQQLSFLIRWLGGIFVFLPSHVRLRTVTHGPSNLNWWYVIHIVPVSLHFFVVHYSSRFHLISALKYVGLLIDYATCTWCI